MAKKPASSKNESSPSKAPAKRSRAKDAALLADSSSAAAPVKSDAPPIPRPGLLRDILGQPRAMSLLASAFKSDRVHHAWIFHGPVGVGKFTTALAFASAALDPTTRVGTDGLPAPESSSPVQRLLASGTHPDMHIITKELARFSEDKQVRDSKQATIAKDVIDRHLIAPAALAPATNFGGRARKVFIVDEAELLDRSPTNAPTQNAILKTLEEPSAGTLIILVTSAEDRLLTTIRSRCQRVGFASLDAKSMDAWIHRSGLSMSEESRPWLVRFADGSPGELMRAIEGGLATWAAKLTPMLADLDRGRPPPDLGPTIAALIEAEAQRVVKASPQASKDAANKSAADRMFRVLSDHVRRRLRESMTAAGSPRSPGDPMRRAQAWLRCTDLLQEAEQQMDSNVQSLFVFSNLAAQMGVTLEWAMRN